jgi:two-component system response regulator HydG
VTKPRVLVAEDKPHILDLVASTLDETCTVYRAADGGQALALIEAEAPFDVVVTDMRMPVANGFAVLAAVRRRSADTQVILLTAYASVPDAVAAMRQGAYDYLEKPFDPDALALTVARAAEQRRTHGAPPVDLGAASDPQRRGFHSTVTAARERVSRDYLVALLREFGGNVAKAARGAGLQRESLYRLLRRYGLRPDDFKPGD